LITWIALILLGGVVALDTTAFGQLMLSRPFVAATLAGVIIGMPLEGATVGAALEALSLSILPVGAARYPDTGTAAVAAVGVLGLSDAAPMAPALLLVIVYGLAWQRIAGASVVGGRYVNERLVLAGRPGRARMDEVIEHRHLATILLDLLRGFVVTFVAMAAGVLLVRWAVPLWSFPAQYAALAVSIAAAAVLAGTAPLFAESVRARAFLVLGLLCGSVFLILR
jgi:mannose/fructose/N-acetylgalactosamine-specific phosphotransferase system component IIC